MADTVVIPATGSGDATPRVATDECAGVGNPAQTAQVQFNKILDGTLNQVQSWHITQQREGLVAERAMLFGDGFNVTTGPDIAANNVGAWVQTLAGTGTNVVATGELNMATGATASSAAQLVSKFVGRLLPGTYNQFTAHLRFGDTGTALNQRNFGAFTANDGYFFQLLGTGVQAVSRRGAVDTVVAHGSFSDADFVIDLNYHKYDILYGGNEAWFFVDNLLRHKVGGAIATPTINNRNLPIQMQNTNAPLTGSANVSMFIQSVGLYRLGAPLARARFRSFVGTAPSNVIVKGEPGYLYRIIIGKTNTTPGQTIQLADNLTDATAAGALAGTSLGTYDFQSSARVIEIGADFYTGLIISISGITAGQSVTLVFD